MQGNAMIKFVLGLIGVIVVIFLGVSLFFDTDAQNSNNLSGVDRPCGGFANIKCPTGLTCVSPQRPYPDQMGVCRPGLNGETTQTIYSLYGNIKNSISGVNDWISHEIWALRMRFSKDPVGCRDDGFCR